jgi:hypothetical protein
MSSRALGSVPAGAKKEKRMPTNCWGGPIKKHQPDPIEQYRELLRQTESQQRPENPSRWTRVVCSDCGEWFASAASSCGTLCEFCPECHPAHVYVDGWFLNDWQQRLYFERLEVLMSFKDFWR